MNEGPYKPRISRTGQCTNHAPTILAAPPIYIKQGAIKLSKMSNKKHAPSSSAATTIQTLIGCRTAQTSDAVYNNETAFPVDYTGENGQQ